MLGLAIGVTTATFTVVDALLIRPVPFKNPGELASVYMGNEHGGRTTVAPAVLHAWRQTPAFTHAEAAQTDVALVEVAGRFIARPMARVTPALFAMLGGVRPLLGRLFDSTEGGAGNDDRVLISESLWRGAFGSDPSLIGRRVTIGTEPAVVVGILPAEFRFPAWDTALWRPVDFDRLPRLRAGERPTVYVRFAAGLPRTDALRLATNGAVSADAANSGLVARVRPIVTDNAYERQALPLLLGGVAFVFLVLCMHVSGLLLSRFARRRKEFGICAALGASPGRLMRQALVESSILGVLGVAAGLVGGWLLVALGRAFLPEAYLMRTLNPLNLDLRAVAIAAVTGVAGTIAVGMAPAWFGSRVDALRSMRSRERSATETRGARALTRGLLIVEIGLACALLIVATLLVRSFVNLGRAGRGLDASGVLTATMWLPPEAFGGRAGRAVVVEALEDRMRHLPGVQRVAWSYGLPPSNGALSTGTWVSDVSGARAVEMTVDRYRVGPAFFALYGIPLTRGRTFEPSDDDRDVIVGERLARTLWPSADPVGRNFSFGTEQFRVVGVAREIAFPSVEAGLDRPEFYERFTGVGTNAMMSIRCSESCPDPGTVRQQLLTVHAAVKVLQVRAVEEAYVEQLARPRAAAALAVVFAAIALVTAGAGLYCVLSFAVGQRRHEFGIRLALGASPARIRRLVIRDGLVVCAAGLTLGVLAASLLARAIASLQYGVVMNDLPTSGVVAGVFGVLVILAFWRPVRDAMGVNPVQLLKTE